MAGHSKWKTIQFRKGKQDSLKSKLYSKYSRDIRNSIKRGGSNIELNKLLKTVIDMAKHNGVPSHVINNAIEQQNAAAELQEEIIYEGFGPENIAFLVIVYSTNRNKSAADVRSFFTKHNGRLGDCLYKFTKYGSITIGKSYVDLIFSSTDLVLDVVENEDETCELLCEATNLHELIKIVQSHNIQIKEFGIVYKGNDLVPVENHEKLEDFYMKLMEVDGVEEVFIDAD